MCPLKIQIEQRIFVFLLATKVKPKMLPRHCKSSLHEVCGKQTNTSTGMLLSYERSVCAANKKAITYLSIDRASQIDSGALAAGEGHPPLAH